MKYVNRETKPDIGEPTLTVIARRFIENTSRTIVDLIPETKRELSRLFDMKVKAPQVVKEERRLKRRSRYKRLRYWETLNDAMFFIAGCSLTLLIVSSGCARSVGLTLHPVKVAGSIK